MRPRLLDLFACAGCGARGYDRTGFEVVCVDKDPQPHNPFEFHQADALEFFADHWREFDVAHASPPCHDHSDLASRSGVDGTAWLLHATRAVLRATGMPYVIENVEGAPLRDPIVLCGAMFPATRVYRHRLFESNLPLTAPVHPKHTELTFTHDKRKTHYGQPLDLDTMRVQVTGGGNAPVWAKAAAMGLAGEGLTGRELNEGLPPAYTEHIGTQLLSHLTTEAVA